MTEAQRTHPVTEAIRLRAPEANRDGWYFKVADATGRSEKAVKNWFYGDNLPDFESYWQLVDYFGRTFHDEVTYALTGWHVIENGDRERKQREQLRGHLHDALALVDEPNVTRLKGRAS